jgi:hypothetical protein
MSAPMKDTRSCCRQSNDFLFGDENEDIIWRLIAALGLKVAIKAEEGLSTHFNGLEILQDRDCIHIHVAPYLDNILDNHGWTEEGKQETRLIEPVHPSSIKELETSEVPDDATAANVIETAAGLAYRNGIGKIIFAYVTCRLGIGYAVTELSKFGTRPTAVHYAALNSVSPYIRQTGNHGLVYGRRAPRMALPRVSFKLLRSMDPADQGIPRPDLATTLCAYVDAAHANFLCTQRSVGAFVFCLAGTAVVYRVRWLATICCSSTEAEFLTTATAAKMSKVLRWIFIELGLPQSEATRLYEDNASAIIMANAKRPRSGAATLTSNALLYNSGTRTTMSFWNTFEGRWIHLKPSRKP